MLAPIMPHITEELYQEIYREYEEEKSIHISKWPEPKHPKFPVSHRKGETLIELISGLRKYKTENGLSLNSELQKVKIYTEKDVDKETLKRAMNITELEISENEPDLTEKIEEVKLDYSLAGPKYGDKIGEIEEALEEEEYRLEPGKLTVAGEILGPEMFKVITSYSASKGEIIETELATIQIAD